MAALAAPVTGCASMRALNQEAQIRAERDMVVSAILDGQRRYEQRLGLRTSRY